MNVRSVRKIKQPDEERYPGVHGYQPDVVVNGLRLLVRSGLLGDLGHKLIPTGGIRLAAFISPGLGNHQGEFCIFRNIHALNQTPKISGCQILKIKTG